MERHDNAGENAGKESNEWPPWLNIPIWSTVVLFSILDFIQKTPLSLSWILGYGALFFVLFANMLPKLGRLRWLLAGTALGLLISSLLVGIYFRSPISTLFH